MNHYSLNYLNQALVYQILVFDAHPIVSSAIVSGFVTHLPDCKSQAFNTTSEILEYLKCNEVHYLISDLITNETAGIDLINQVLMTYPDTRVIVYSGVSNAFIISKLERMGVLAFVSKQEPVEHLSKIIIENSKKSNPSKGKPLEITQLTKRERQIVDFLVLGKGSKEIAAVLNTSVNTVNNQKNNLLKKYDCANTVELVSILSKIGYINII